MSVGMTYATQDAHTSASHSIGEAPHQPEAPVESRLSPRLSLASGPSYSNALAPDFGAPSGGSIFSAEPSTSDVHITDADISQLQQLQLQLPSAAVSSGELRAGLILKLGGKKPFFQWQWRRCVVTISGKLQYYDPKKQKNSIRGELALKGAQFEVINEGHVQFPRLKKFSEKVETEAATSYFSVKPSNVSKTYFFAVPSMERDQWLKALQTSEKAESLVREQQALQLKMQYARQQEYMRMQQHRQAQIGGGLDRPLSTSAVGSSVPQSHSSPPFGPISLSHSSPAIASRSQSDSVSALGTVPVPQVVHSPSSPAIHSNQPVVSRSTSGSAGSASAAATPRGDESSLNDLLSFSYSKAPEAGTEAAISAPSSQPTQLGHRPSLSRRTEPPQQFATPQVMLPRRSVSAHPDLAIPDMATSSLDIQDFTFDVPDDPSATTGSQAADAGRPSDSFPAGTLHTIQHQIAQMTYFFPFHANRHPNMEPRRTGRLHS